MSKACSFNCILNFNKTFFAFGATVFAASDRYYDTRIDVQLLATSTDILYSIDILHASQYLREYSALCETY